MIEGEQKRTARRAWVMAGVLLVALGAIAARLENIQVVQAAHYQSLGQQDYLRTIPVSAPRGEIVTSDGMVLANNQPAWEIEWMNPSQGSLPHQEAARIAKLLGVSVSQLNGTVHYEETHNPPFWPVILDPSQGLSPTAITHYQENRTQYPDIHLLVTAKRSYPQGSLFGNFVGFVTSINGPELKAHPNQGYTASSLFGQQGLEAEYQSLLRGQSGQQLVQVNSQGQFLKIYGSKPPVPGNTIHLTINGQMEMVATQALQFVMHAMQTSPSSPHSPKATKGAVIVLNPENGAILAAVSLPTYNPNLLDPATTQYVNQLNQTGAWVNRVYQGQYAPGSVFKPIIAGGALASGVITPSTVVVDHGYFPLDPAFKNWYGPGFGPVNLERALEVSDDTYFYWVGYWMGIQRMDHYLSLYGLNSTTGLDIPGEVPSQMPTPQRYQTLEGQPWTWGQNLNTAIGQGISAYTLIGLARAEAAVVNGGTLYQPHFLSYVTSPSGKVIDRFKPVVQQKLPISRADYHVIHVGMERSAQRPLGTGYGAMNGIPMYVGTKTGTAQRVNSPINNAFFESFAPAASYAASGPLPTPKLEVLVYIHDGVFGAYSGFVARAIYDQYFHLQDPYAKTWFDTVYGGNYPWPFSWTGKPMN